MTANKDLQVLADKFVAEALSVFKRMSLDEFNEFRGRASMMPPSGKRVRRTMNEINSVIEQIVALLRKHKQGLRSEEIKKELGLAPKDLSKPLAIALERKFVKSKGEKRATTYFLA